MESVVGAELLWLPLEWRLVLRLLMLRDFSEWQLVRTALLLRSDPVRVHTRKVFSKFFRIISSVPGMTL